MPTPLDIARQFYAVEYQLAVLKGMFQQLAGAAPTAYPPVPPPPAYAMPPTEAPEPREPAQHFDGRKWAPGPTPAGEG